MMSVGQMRVRIGLRQNDFHLRHRDHRQEPNEQQEQRSEDAESADKSPNVDPGWNEQSPRRWQEVAMQSADDDDKTLEPHAGVHAHADEIHHQNVAPAPPEPEKLRRKNVAEQHAGPPVPPIRPENANSEREPLPMVAAVPGHEEFHR